MVNIRKQNQPAGGYALASVVIAAVILMSILAILLQYIVALSVYSRNIRHTFASNNAAVSGVLAASKCYTQDLSLGDSDLSAKYGCVMDGASTETLGANSAEVYSYQARASGRLRYSIGALLVGKINQGFLNHTSEFKARIPRSPVEPLADATRIANSDTHTCVIASGKVYCWGRNTYGQLGNGTTSPSKSYHSPVAVDMSSSSSSLRGKVVTDISVGNSFTCALAGGEIHCWGRNAYGQLGNGSRSSSSRPVKINTLSPNNPIQDKRVSYIQSRRDGTCVLASGEAYCWGRLRGLGGYASHATEVSDFQSPIYRQEIVDLPNPVRIGSASYGYLKNAPISQLAMTDSGVCMLSRGAVYCIGGVLRKDTYELTTDGIQRFHWSETYGMRPPTPYPHQTHLTAETNNNLISSITSGSTHVCGITTSEKVYCWGGNSVGQLGNGRKAGSDENYYYPYEYLPPKFEPEAVRGIPASEAGVRQLSSNGGSFIGHHTCAVTNKSKLYCWGDNFYGQVGVGSTPDQVLTAKEINLNGLPVEQVATSSVGTCAIAGGFVYCWGDVEKQTTEHYDPDILSSYSNQQFLVDSSVNTPTQIDLSTLNISPKDVQNHSRSVDGYCGASQTGTVYCWNHSKGSSFNNSKGQLGDGTTTPRRTPVSIHTKHAANIKGKSFSQVASGWHHACGLSGGRVYCWGSNNHGQLGSNNASIQFSTTPVEVATNGSSPLKGSLVTDISAGKETTCAVSEAKVYCWGRNDHYQAGNGGSNIHRPNAIDMSSSDSSLRNKKVVQVAVGANHACALANDNTIHCWGKNSEGQVGSGSTTSGSQPPRQVDTQTNSSPLYRKDIKMLTAGDNHTCAATYPEREVGSKVACWGANNKGQLGINGTANSAKPALSLENSGSDPYVIIDMDANTSNTCTVRAVGTESSPRVGCWGDNGRWQLPNDSSRSLGFSNKIVEKQASKLTNASTNLRYVATGVGTTCAGDTKFICWGYIEGITSQLGKYIIANSAFSANPRPQETSPTEGGEVILY